jgi:hypothetical protein
MMSGRRTRAYGEKFRNLYASYAKSNDRILGRILVDREETSIKLRNRTVHAVLEATKRNVRMSVYQQTTKHKELKPKF